MNQALNVNSEPRRGNFKTYATGFILALVFTVLAFAAGGGYLSSRPVVVLSIIVGAALVQMLVHLHYFLHLDLRPANSWNLMALVFTVLIIVLFVGGTLWIMTDLHYRM